MGMMVCVPVNPIRQTRETVGLTQERLAYLAGVSVSTVQRAELRDASIGVLRRLAVALGVPVADLLTPAESEPETAA